MGTPFSRMANRSDQRFHGGSKLSNRLFAKKSDALVEILDYVHRGKLKGET
jgi:hypothetical protein